MNGKHILICGERGVGKSTLIERLLNKNMLPVYGYFTRTTPRRADGFHSIYIYPAGSPDRSMSENNHIGDCNSRERTVNADVFTTLGVEYLRREQGGIVVMDELGFMETASPKFCAAVMDCFDGDTPVLASCKARYDVEFLNRVRAHPKTRVYDITKENRDELYDELLPIICSWR